MTDAAPHEQPHADLTDSAARPATDSLKPERTRTSAAWFAAGAGLLIALLALIFVLQNDQSVGLELLWTDFELPVGATMLLSMVIGGLIVIAIGAARVLQLRLAQRRHRGAHRNR